MSPSRKVAKACAFEAERGILRSVWIFVLCPQCLSLDPGKGWELIPVGEMERTSITPGTSHT